MALQGTITGHEAQASDAGRSRQDEWVEGLRRGDPRTFDQVYDAYRGRIFGYLLRLLRNRPLAEDLLQETWLRVARNAHRLHADSRLEPWLFRIAHNLVMSHRRRAILYLDRLDQLRRQEPEAPTTPFEASVHTEIRSNLERALGDLKPAQREVLLLVGVEGLGPSEAAHVLGVAPATLRKRLERARTALAEALENQGQQRPRRR